MYDYLIVGAGLFGSTVAQILNANSKSVLVIDKRDHIGGNIYTELIHGIMVHKYGAHIFHTNNESVWNYINQFATFNNFINSPKAIFNNKVYSLPFNMNTFREMWDITTPNEAKQIIDKQRCTIKSTPKNLEEQAISLVGIDIYEKLIKGYTVKQWGDKCTNLPADIIKRLPIRFVYDNNYFDAKYQGIPVNGYTEMISNMLKGIDVKLQVDYLTDREYFNSIAHHIIYTGPIDEFFNYKYGHLGYRSLRFDIDCYADVDNFQGNAVINYTNSYIPYTRIIEHKHFTNQSVSGTVITHEYPETYTGYNEPYYPINNETNQNIYTLYKAESMLLDNVIFGGRLGEYKYYDMDKVIESALWCANDLMKGEI